MESAGRDGLKVTTLNVNGLRSALRKGLRDWVQAARPDVLLLQETRVQVEPPGLGVLDGYERVFHGSARPGYSGAAVFSRLPIAASRPGLGRDRHRTRWPRARGAWDAAAPHGGLAWLAPACFPLALL